MTDWIFLVLPWKFPLLSLPSVEASNLLPFVEASNLLLPVQASICFPFIMEDRRMACKFGEVCGDAWKVLTVEGVLARQSSWDKVGVSGGTWNHMEARGRERSSLKASAEVVLEASTVTSTGRISGSFQSHTIWERFPLLPCKNFHGFRVSFHGTGK